MGRRLQLYLRLEKLTQEAFGYRIGVTGVTVGRYCRALSDPDHRRPRRATGQRISDLTHGVIHTGNYADEITDAEAADMMAEIARRAAAAEVGA